MTEPISQNETATSAQPPGAVARVFRVEIDELIIDGFGARGDRPPSSRQQVSGRADSSRPGSGREGTGRPGSGREGSGREASGWPGPRRPAARLDATAAAAALRRELARELAGAGPEAEQLARAIADAVFRQLTAAPPVKCGPR
ncbi:MAG TPA: hypothetical protein VMG38_24965 [Trebonia sp.]|nr:hypothetical protein [Trebonia sp.]